MDEYSNSMKGPHQGQPVFTTGKPLEQARAAMIMIHGRGASAQDILSLSQEFSQSDFAYLAPQANNYTWYPNSFLASLESNEPGLSSGLAVIDALLAQIAEAGIPAERTILLGFSQGACLSLEYAARHPQRYGGIAGLSGGLIGPDGTPRDYSGSMANTPVFLGCSDRDFHIPKERVQFSAEMFQRLNASVTARLYPNMGHTVNMDEIQFVQHMMTSVGA